MFTRFGRTAFHYLKNIAIILSLDDYDQSFLVLLLVNRTLSKESMSNLSTSVQVTGFSIIKTQRNSTQSNSKSNFVGLCQTPRYRQSLTAIFRIFKDQENSSFGHNFQFHYMYSCKFDPVLTRNLKIPVRNQKLHPEHLTGRFQNTEATRAPG